MRFKDQIQVDIDKTFLNVEEFAEMHEVTMGGITADIKGMIDEDVSEPPVAGIDGGIFFVSKRFYAKEEDLPMAPKIGRIITIDGKDYMVMNISNENGIVVMNLDVHSS